MTAKTVVLSRIKYLMDHFIWSIGIKVSWSLAFFYYIGFLVIFFIFFIKDVRDKFRKQKIISNI